MSKEAISVEDTSARSAMKLAAIFNLAEKIYKEKKVIPWTEAIEEALAQSHSDVKQEHTGEPVAWMNHHGGVSLRLFNNLGENSYTIPLYTTPQPVTESHKRKPLTDDLLIFLKNREADSYSCGLLVKDALALLAAHGIKE